MTEKPFSKLEELVVAAASSLKFADTLAFKPVTPKTSEAEWNSNPTASEESA